MILGTSESAEIFRHLRITLLDFLYPLATKVVRSTKIGFRIPDHRSFLTRRRRDAEVGKWTFGLCVSAPLRDHPQSAFIRRSDSLIFLPRMDANERE